MVKLFLDLGNTRIKVALEDDSGYQYLGPISMIDFSNANLLEEFLDSVKPTAVFMSSVLSAADLESVKSIIQSTYELFPVMLTAQKSCCGLTTGYDDFNQLGDDRWMALQGLYSMTKDPALVIDAGTAMTVDAVLSGKHLGGFIVPGLNSLRASLGTDTANLTLVEESSFSSVSDKVPTGLLATNTQSAILGGALYMTASFCNRLITDLNQQIGTEFKVYITGGNADKLKGLIDVHSVVVSDLVLLGMKKIVESVKK
jgi:type III pantothenate kinase